MISLNSPLNYMFFCFKGKSLLLTIYLNMSIVYMHLKNFNLALQVLKDAFEISDKNSQVYFRRSQVK